MDPRAGPGASRPSSSHAPSNRLSLFPASTSAGTNPSEMVRRNWPVRPCWSGLDGGASMTVRATSQAARFHVAVVPPHCAVTVTGTAPARTSKVRMASSGKTRVSDDVVRPRSHSPASSGHASSPWTSTATPA